MAERRKRATKPREEWKGEIYKGRFLQSRLRRSFLRLRRLVFIDRVPIKPPATEAKKQAYSCTNLSITSHLIQLKLPPLCGNLREADKFSVTGAGRLLWEFVNKNCIWAFYKRNFVKTAMSRAVRLVYVSSVG